MENFNLCTLNTNMIYKVLNWLKSFHSINSPTNRSRGVKSNFKNEKRNGTVVSTSYFQGNHPFMTEKYKANKI